MISAGKSGRPCVGLPLSAGAEVVRVKFVEARMSQSQFTCGSDGADMAGAEGVEEVTDERNWQTFDELKFFTAARIQREEDLSLCN